MTVYGRMEVWLHDDNNSGKKKKRKEKNKKKEKGTRKLMDVARQICDQERS